MSLSEKTPGAVLDFWLGPADAGPDSLETRYKRWFTASQAFDREVRERFEPWVVACASGELQAWEREPEGTLAAIILLDQFPRNIYRGTPRAYAYDPRALEITLAGIDAGRDRELTPLQRVFFYMPLQHAESATIQERSVELFECLADAPMPGGIRKIVESFAAYAHDHRDIVVRFGRFPHRNGVLSRPSTAAEAQFLDAGASSYGQ
jgi:uncharacterized protein (DUF924 family)